MTEPYKTFLVFVLIVGVLVGVFIGGWMVSSEIRSQATEAGVAEWQCDPQTGARQFVWLSPEREETGP